MFAWYHGGYTDATLAVVRQIDSFGFDLRYVASHHRLRAPVALFDRAITCGRVVFGFAGADARVQVPACEPGRGRAPHHVQQARE